MLKHIQEKVAVKKNAVQIMHLLNTDRGAGERFANLLEGNYKISENLRKYWQRKETKDEQK